MPSKTTKATETWVAAASGPGNATFRFDDHPGQWTVHTSISNVGIVTAFSLLAEKSESIYLALGEHLHIRGRGTASIIADIVVA